MNTPMKMTDLQVDQLRRFAAAETISDFDRGRLRAMRVRAAADERQYIDELLAKPRAAATVRPSREQLEARAAALRAGLRQDPAARAGVAADAMARHMRGFGLTPLEARDRAARHVQPDDRTQTQLLGELAEVERQIKELAAAS